MSGRIHPRKKSFKYNPPGSASERLKRDLCALLADQLAVIRDDLAEDPAWDGNYSGEAVSKEFKRAYRLLARQIRAEGAWIEQAVREGRR